MIINLSPFYLEAFKAFLSLVVFSLIGWGVTWRLERHRAGLALDTELAKQRFSKLVEVLGHIEGLLVTASQMDDVVRTKGRKAAFFLPGHCLTMTNDVLSALVPSRVLLGSVLYDELLSLMLLGTLCFEQPETEPWDQAHEAIRIGLQARRDLEFYVSLVRGRHGERPATEALQRFRPGHLARFVRQEQPAPDLGPPDPSG